VSESQLQEKNKIQQSYGKSDRKEYRFVCVRECVCVCMCVSFKKLQAVIDNFDKNRKVKTEATSSLSPQGQKQ